MSTKPSLNHHKPNTKAGVVLEFPEELDNPEFRDSWEQWEKHLKEKNCKTTPSAKVKQLKKCQAMGSDRAIVAIDFSITANYQSPFEPRNFGKPPKRPPSVNTGPDIPESYP